MRSLYSDLAIDASADQNYEMDERVRMILQGEPGIVADLRKFSKGRPGDTFDVFFEHLGAEIEEVLAADDRRHNTAHLSEWISLPDMINKVSSTCPDGTPIPSKALVRLQFMPRNINSHTSMSFTGRYAVQYKIQRRQLRSAHPDSHYCGAQFRYMREMAVSHREEVNFFCLDDKSKVPYGEPGTRMATGVRGRMALAPSTSTIVASDHDQHSKGSYTPSVSLHVEIPEDINTSFYRGQVTVVLNDSVFQASSPFRHSASLRTLLQTDPKPLLFIFTDGGPDHRLNYESVRLSLIALFKACNLDMVVAGRCAPGQSWMNPVERIMSLLNLALQNVALERPLTQDEIEDVLKKCNSMQAIRTAAAKQNERAELDEDGDFLDVEKAWLDCLAPMTEMIRKRFERLILKGKQVVTKNPVNQDQIESLQGFAATVDPSIDFSKLQKRFLSSKQDYTDWCKKHTRCRTYTYQIRKCDDATCCQPKQVQQPLEWLPDPVLDATGLHYKPFEDVYRKMETNDESRPSNQPFEGKASEDDQGCKTSLLTAQRAKSIAKCQECQKPRVVYCQQPKLLTSQNILDIETCVTEYDYTCGSQLLPKSHPLYSKVFVRLSLTCGSPVEFPYYSSKVGMPDICCFCGEDQASRPQELLKDYKVVLPVCKQCTENGRSPITKYPRHK